MMVRSWLFGAAIGAAGLASADSAAPQDRSRIERSVVRIFVLIDGRVQASSTGFVISAAGHVVTAPEIGMWRRANLRIFAPDLPTDGTNPGEPGRVLAIDRPSNIVVLHAPSLRAAALPLQLRPLVGPMLVSAASYPRTVEGKWPRQVMALSPGAILEWGLSSPFGDRDAPPGAFHRYDAVPRPSTNGGPLVNTCGEAVGISVLADLLATGTRLYAASAQLIHDAAKSLGIDAVTAKAPCID